MIKIKKDIAATPKSAESMDDAKFTFASAKNSDKDHSQFLNSKNLNRKKYGAATPKKHIIKKNFFITLN